MIRSRSMLSALFYADCLASRAGGFQWSAFMTKLRLNLACWNYDRTRALADRSVQPEGIDLNYLELLAAHYELPALSTLRRLAGGVQSQATQDWFTAVSGRLDDTFQRRLDCLLTVPKDAQESEFATLCKPTKRVSRNHLDELLKQL